MIKVSKIANHMSAEEVRMKLRMTAGSLKIQKWLVIYNALVDPRPISEIAKHTGLTESSVSKILSEYNLSGPDAVETSTGSGANMWFESGRVGMKT